MPSQAPATTAEFLALVRRTGLLPEVPPDLPDPPDKAAGELVRRKLLTPFQARMILAGRTRGFLLGDYVIRDQIGQGGMGAVYLGVHRTLGRKAAVKVLPPGIAADQLSRQRFLREARTAAALDHPNVVKLYDVARDEDIWFLVMEHVEGRTLEQLVKGSGPLHHSTAAQYVAQAASGLQHAHEKGFIHRDIKPGNLILTPEGGVKILDMGLARPVGPEGVLTVAMDPGAVVGTADYISPEQVTSDPDVDIRADIYCLGLTFFYLVTGRPPFDGSTAGKLVKQKLAQLPSLADLLPGFPPELADVVDRMTAKERGERYNSPADVILALKPWLEHSPQLMAGVSGTQAANDRLSREAMEYDEPDEGDEPPPKKGPPVWLWAVLVSAGMAVLAGGVVAALVLSKSTAPTTTPVAPRPTDPATPATEATPSTQAAPTTPPTKPATPATTPAPPAGKVIYDPELTGLTPFEVVLTNDAGKVSESKSGAGSFPDGWSASTWQPGNRVRVFATAGGLGTQAEKGSAILFAPSQKLDQKAVTVTLEYRSTTADKKLDLRVRELDSKDNIVRQLPPTGGEWKTADVEFDTSKIKNARFEFHNQDTSNGAVFEVRRFTLRGGK